MPKEILPKFMSSGRGGHLNLVTAGYPDLEDTEDQKKVFPFNITSDKDSTPVDETDFSKSSDKIDNWDKQIKLRKILICDDEGNKYYMVVLGTGLLDENAT
jgi:hypothetical protein